MRESNIHVATSVPKDFLEVLGAITVNFSALENALSLSVAFLLAGPGGVADKRYQVITAQLSFKQLVWMVANLYRERFPGRNETVIQDYVKQCFDAEGKRNRLVHSLWVGAMPDAPVSSATRLKATSRADGLKFKAEQHTKEELTEVANDLAKLSYNLRSFVIGEILTQLPGGDA